MVEVQVALQATVDRLDAALDSLDETAAAVTGVEILHPFLLGGA